MSKKIIQVGNIHCGTSSLFLISGPCVIEEERVMMQTAEQLRTVSERLKIPVIYKSSFSKDNRSSLNYYNGPGLEKGVKLLAKVKEQFGFPVLTDIHYPDQASAAAGVVDVLQIPAYLCMQTGLMVAAAKTGRVINIKHGQFLAPENMKHPVGKCVEAGNDQIILTERGYTMGYNDLVVDPRSFYHLSQLGYPVVFDITHSIRKYGIPSADAKGGAREFQPEKALCDAASQLCVYDLENFLKPLLELHQVEVNYRNR
jgi:2-dehydro-3-deoxyphosphooctonate aldolase (KDO 8-P synthase)